MLNHEASTPLEADQQNVLTCTAAAISAETVISFDEWWIEGLRYLEIINHLILKILYALSIAVFIAAADSFVFAQLPIGMPLRVKG